jgi:glycosyltransferase involved in cell wall biosynthesis
VNLLFTSIDKHLSGNGGGMSVYIDELTKGLAALGHKVHVAFPSPKELEETVGGVHYHGLSLGNKHYYLSKFPMMDGPARLVREREYGSMFFQKFEELNRKERIDLVELVESGHSAIALSNIHPTKKILRMHGNQFAFRSHSNEKLTVWDHQEERLLQKSLRQVDGLSAPSSYYLNFKSAEIQIPKAVIPNPVRNGFFGLERKNEGRPVKLLSVTRFEYCKGIVELIEAFHLVERDCELHIVADPNSSRLASTDMDRLLRIISEDSRIVLHGYLQSDEVIDLLSQSDLFILSAHFESFGIAVYEAMAMGVPVLSSRGGGLSDHIDKSNALVCDPVSKEALKEKIESFLTEGPDSSRIQKAKEKAAEFRLEEIVKQELDFIQRIIHG